MKNEENNTRGGGMNSFKQWIQYNETVRITTKQDLKKAGVGNDVVPLQEMIDIAFETIIQGRYKLSEDPLEGGKIFNGIVGIMYKGKIEPMRIKIVVNDPSVFTQQGPRGWAELDRKIVRIFWSKEKGYGVTTDGEKFPSSRLYVTLTHEITHLIDKRLRLEQEKYEKKNSDFYGNEEKVKGWRATHHIDSSSLNYWNNKDNKMTPEKYKKYIQAKHERLANRTSFAYELARRLISADVYSSSDSLNKRSYRSGMYADLDNAEILNRLKQVTYEDLPHLTTIRPEDIKHLFEGQPKEFKRFMNDVYKYMVKMLEERPEKQTAPVVARPQQPEPSKPAPVVAPSKPTTAQPAKKTGWKWLFGRS